MKLTLTRTSESPDGPTFGTITNASDGSTMVPATLELPDRDNQPMVSRIPAGTYTFVRTLSHHIGYEVFESQDVPNRTGIAIHKGNWMRDTNGCVLCGEGIAELDGEPAVADSKLAFDTFMGMMTGIPSFTMTVVDVVV